MKSNRIQRHRLNEKRKVTRFLIFPLILPVGPQPDAPLETRWLERASWIEEPVSTHWNTKWEKMFWAEEWEKEFGHLITEER